MNNHNLTQKSSTAPPKSQTNSQAVDELVALQHEISQFRKDFKTFSNELSLKVAFGVIGSLIIMFLLSLFVAALLPTILYHP